MTHIRFANNANPGNLTLRAASITVNNIPRDLTFGIDNYGMSNTTITNLAIQGAYAGIRIANGHHNTVKNCYIEHGPSNNWFPSPDGIRHRNSERQYLANVYPGLANTQEAYHRGSVRNSLSRIYDHILSIASPFEKRDECYQTVFPGSRSQ